MKSFVRVKKVKVLKKRKVLLEFTDGVRREVDLGPYLRGPIFKALREDDKAFGTIRVDPKLGTVVWDNGADIDPDVLYGTHLPAWMVEKSTGAVAARESQAGYRKRKG